MSEIEKHTTTQLFHTLDQFGPEMTVSDRLALEQAVECPEKLLECQMRHAQEGFPYLTGRVVMINRYSPRIREEDRIAPDLGQYAVGAITKDIFIDDMENNLITARPTARIGNGSGVRVDCGNHPAFWMELSRLRGEWRVTGGRHPMRSAVTSQRYSLAVSCTVPNARTRWAVTEVGKYLEVRDEASPNFFLCVENPLLIGTENENKRAKRNK